MNNQSEQVRKVFAGECDFTMAVNNLSQLPEGNLPEVALAGRSNVGKSSLLNAITGRKLLARVSNTPGRTRLLNFFNLGGRGNLVDMPGYGYAKVSKTERDSWRMLLQDYARGRTNLRGILLLIDARRGIFQSDKDFLSILDTAGVSARIILTKADKIKTQQIDALMENLAVGIKKHPSAFPDPILTSSVKGKGIVEVQELIASLMGFFVSPSDAVKGEVDTKP